MLVGEIAYKVAYVEDERHCSCRVVDMGPNRSARSKVGIAREANPFQATLSGQGVGFLDEPVQERTSLAGGHLPASVAPRPPITITTTVALATWSTTF